MHNNRLLDIFLIVVVIIVGTFAAFDVIRRIIGMFNPSANNKQQADTQVLNEGNRVNSVRLVSRENSNVSNSITQYPSINGNSGECYVDRSLSIREADSLYHRYVEYILKLNFKNPELYQNNKAVIQISVDKNGNILAYNITEQSCSSEYFNAIIDALKRSTPLQPFIPIMGNDDRAYELRFNGNELYAHPGNSYNGYNAIRLPIKNVSTKSCCINDAKETHIQHSIKSVDTMGDTCNSMDIQANWVPVLTQNNSTYVTFDIYKNGSKNITKITTDNQQAREAAINAINHTKCKPFPKEFNKDSVTVNYSFYVNDIRKY